MPTVIPVTFLRGYRSPSGLYNQGETAGFPKDLADELVARKIARLHEQPKQQQAKPATSK